MNTILRIRNLIIRSVVTSASKTIIQTLVNMGTGFCVRGDEIRRGVGGGVGGGSNGFSVHVLLKLSWLQL